VGKKIRVMERKKAGRGGVQAFAVVRGSGKQRKELKKALQSWGLKVPKVRESKTA